MAGGGQIHENKDGITLIRPADHGDFDAVNELFREGDQMYFERHPEFFEPVMEPPRDHDWLNSVLASDEERLLLAELDGKLVGLVHGILISVERRGLRRRKRGHIDTIIVTEHHRNRGIGTQLMDSIEDWFSQNGVTQADLGVWVFNSDAMRLYKRLGYEPFHIQMRKYPFLPNS